MGNAETGVVHVDIERLDRLLTLVGELVITRTAFAEQAKNARTRHGFKEHVLDLLENAERVGRIGEEIQGKIIKARLVPVGSIFNRFEALVQDLSAKSSKQIRLEVLGEKTEVDKRTIDELAEPLVHLVRNALDHGIETVAERQHAGKSSHGTITLEAMHEGNRLVVEVRDDGRGVDLDAVRAKAVARSLLAQEQADLLGESETLDLLFQTGFSTTDRVTELSGRGVGLDVARRRVEELGGTVELRSARGRGCCARISLPLTAAIVEALLVEVSGETYALPLELVQQIVKTAHGQVSTVEGREVLELRGEALALLPLYELFDAPKPGKDGAGTVVVVPHRDKEIGLVVDRIVERREIVIKSIGRRFSSARGLAGASIGGDGRVIMVLDVPTLCGDAIDVQVTR